MNQLDNGKAFYNHKVNGVRFRFPNGNALSTVWGYGTYSDNYDMDDIEFSQQFKTVRGSNTCEIMPINCDEKTRKKLQKIVPELKDNSVAGHLDMTTWLKVVKVMSEATY